MDSAWTRQKQRLIKGLFTLLKGAREPKKMTVAAPDILALTRDARLAPYAMSAIPAWLFAADGSRVLWANASGAGALNAPSVATLAERIFTADEPLGADIARLAETLPPTSQKYERLRDIGSSLVCACSRVEIAGVAGILVTASEPARKVPPLAERAAMLFGASSQPLAVFSTDGALLYTNGDLAAGTTLESLGADAANAERLGSGGNTVLLALLPRERAEARAEQATEQAKEVEARAEEQPSSPSIEQPLAPGIAEEQSAAAPGDKHEEIPAPAPERPLRFVWTMDADERFNLAAPTFADAMGPPTAEAIGKPWREIAAALGVDTEGRFASAVAARDTFSGIVLAWPAASGDAVSVELSGLPIFDRDRTFKGYRGFGVCRDGAHAAPKAPPVQPIEAPPAPPAQPIEAAPAPPAHVEPPKEPERPILTVVPAAKNVVPFPGATEKRPALTPVERSAFVEIGEKLKNGAPDVRDPCAIAGAPRTARAAGGRHRTDPERLRHAGLERGRRAEERRGAARRARAPAGRRADPSQRCNCSTQTAPSSNGPATRTSPPSPAAGGLERLVVDPQAGALDRVNGTGKTFTIATRTGETLTCEGRLYSVPWQGESALMLALIRTAEAARLRDTEITLRAAEAEIRELRSILDTATDGIVVVDRDGLILSLNRPPRRCSATSITRSRGGPSPSCSRRKASAWRATISTG